MNNYKSEKELTEIKNKIWSDTYFQSYHENLKTKDAKIASSIAFSDAELAIGYMLEKIPWHLKPNNVITHGLKEI